MTLFIRDSKNKTLIEFEAIKREGELEPSACLDVTGYSRFLILHSPREQDKIIEIFNNLDEIRGWYYEWYLTNRSRPRPENKDEMKILISSFLLDSGVYELDGVHLVED